MKKRRLNSIPQEAYTYYSNTDDDSNAVYNVASDTVYQETGGDGAETTSYAYTYYSGTNAVYSITTTLPVIATDQNGSDSANTTTTVENQYGQPIWTMDSNGYLSYTQYDPLTGAVVEQIQDVNTEIDGDYSNLPEGWTTPEGGGLNLVTTFTVDDFGRTTEQVNPNGSAVYYVYNDALDETRTYDWDTTTHTEVGPTTVTVDDLVDGFSETFTMTATPSVSDDAPTGAESIADIQSLSRTYYTPEGTEIAENDYFNLGGLTYTTGSMGTVNVNYYETQYGYDDMGNQSIVIDPTGTIYITVFDGQGQEVSTWIGTDDTPESGTWSPTNNTSPSNMVETESFQYDGGEVGDGNLTQTIQYPAGDTGERVTDNYFNWEDEEVATKSGVSEDEDDGVNRPLTVYSYDNLGEVTETQVYNGDGITPTISSGELSLPEDSYTDEPAADSLQAQTITSYDSQGQVWQTQVYSVNPTTGAVSSAALTTENYYDPNGNLIASSAPGGLWTKTTYNGAGWPVMQYLTDGGSGTSYADASIVSSDVVLTQTQQLYDNDGNVVESITSDRFSTDSTSATGALGTRDSGIEARTYYSGNYYDDANRLIATANVGTNGGSSWTMPSTPPSRTDNALVTTYGYAADAVQTVTLTGGPTGGTFTLTFDGYTTGTISYNASVATVQSDLAALTSVGSGNVTVTTGINGGWEVRFMGALVGVYQNQMTASGSGLTGGTSPGVSVATVALGGDNGNVVDTTDPDDIDTRDYYNPLGQVVQEVQDFTTGAITASTNKTTDYAYNSPGMTSLTAAMLNSDGTITGETTEWIYGVTTGTGSDIDSNDIVSATYQPNPSTGAPDSSLATTVTVDALGETITSTDPNGTEHEYGFDVLGQQTVDDVTTLGTGVDGTVRKITTAYTTLGNPYLVTSLNSSSTILNQIEYVYNGLDDVYKEFEAVNGAVNVDTTPYIEYDNTDLTDGNNDRLEDITYPDGYTVDYVYSSGLDNDISRLSYLSDDTGTLQSYSYLGLNTVVVMDEPLADLELTYLSTDDGTSTSDDQYTGLDQFGRVDEQLWYNTTTSTAVYDVQYIRDDDGNVQFEIDNVNSAQGAYLTYDSLGQVTGYERGDVVYLGPDYGISGTPSVTESFAFDSLGNHLVDSTTTTGTVTIDSGFNYDNQIASISSGTLPTYDSNGNMLTDQNDFVYVVNAWNEIVTVKNSGGTTLEAYSYDGFGDRMTNTVGSTTTNFFYSTSGQVLEEQANATGYYTQRYVWSLTYINSMVDRDTDTSGSGLTATGSEFSQAWQLQDANYNTVALVVMSDGSATVVERYAYLPFGSVTYMNGSYSVISGSSYNWLNLFQGERQDSTTGNNMSLTDWENPGTGTWMSENPMGLADGNNNLNGFESNNTIIEADPTGQQVTEPPSCAVGAPVQITVEDILNKAQEFVDQIGKESPDDLHRNVTIPGWPVPGNGPCFHFANAMIKWRDKLDPSIKQRIKINTQVFTIDRKRFPKSPVGSHIIVIITFTGKDGKEVILWMDGSNTTKNGADAGNLGNEQGLITGDAKEDFIGKIWVDKKNPNGQYVPSVNTFDQATKTFIKPKM